MIDNTFLRRAFAPAALAMILAVVSAVSPGLAGASTSAAGSLSAAASDTVYTAAAAPMARLDAAGG
jgi:hypothetical protein